eukprot:1743685-Amphidinium_carterae.1
MHANDFEGALPEGGLQEMRAMRELLMYGNRFAGTLPNRAVAGLGALIVHKNCLEGRMSQPNVENFPGHM